ncbi:MAG: glycosyl hydrolase [Verrucomicrobiota bacterium]|mgnify:CR=1 FL=1
MKLKQIGCAVGLWLATLFGECAADPLEQGFANPPEPTKPWCYWYWISDNISKEGITRDLEAMKRVGIGEALVGNIFLDTVPAGRIKVLTPEWWALVEHAIREGGRVGVNIGLFNCPGWSQSGGPWITPQQTMRYLASAELRVTGPMRLQQLLPLPATPFQDVAVLAFPAPQHDTDHIAARAPRVTSLPAASHVDKLLDGKDDTVVAFPDGAGRGQKAFTVEISVAEPFTARSLQIVPGSEPFGAECELQAADAAGQFRTVHRFKCDRSNMKQNVGFLPRGPVTIAFAPTTAKTFRLVFTDAFGPGKKLELAELNLSGAARLESFVEKQLGKMHPTPLPLGDTYLWAPPAEPELSGAVVPANKVVDLTPHLAADGTLTWDVPPGEWIIQRTGMTPTGMQNSPASPEGQGLEVDKMNRELARQHFDAFIGEVLRRMPAAERTAFKRVVADSYEMGSQNWTDGFGEKFQKRYGYDPKPWLPVLTGRIVGSADQSERFLWDLRRLVADRVASDYVGGLREACHEHGLELWLENYGHWGFPGEFLNYGAAADRIGGEFWVTGDLGSIECRAASSSANTYGKRFVSAEAFTGGPAFQNAPRALKSRGDWAFAEGVNHFVLHVYIQQPWEDKVPGVNAWFGTEFNRHNTWFEQSRAWIDYLRRSCWLLQQGHRVADVAYFIGEDAPKMTGQRDPALPPGRDFDFINAEVIEQRLTVQNGRLTLPDGPAYRVLVLPPQTTMRPAVLRKLRELVRAGATVVGPAPVKSPSMENYPQADEEVRRIAAELWPKAGANRVGKGQVIPAGKLEEILTSLGAAPDFESATPLRFTHRRDGETDIYFVANPKAEAVTATVALRAGSRAPELWDPETGAIASPAVYDVRDGVVRLPLQLGPDGSVFVVFRKPAAPAAQRVVSVHQGDRELLGTKIATSAGAAVQLDRQNGKLQLAASQSGEYQLTFADGTRHPVQLAAPPAPVALAGPWEVAFVSGRGAPPTARFEELVSFTSRPEQGIKFYSGTTVYRKRFELSGPGDDSTRAWLELGEVRDLAVVRLNGRELRTLWLAPWRVDVTTALKPGVNDLELEVVNVWNNRLIGDLSQPEAQRHTFLAARTVKRAASLLPAGLLGPVTLEFTRTIGIE